MNLSVIGKITGWGQFALQLLGQVATTGLPTGAFGWLGLLTSLATAVGIHAASSTDGTPPAAK